MPVDLRVVRVPHPTHPYRGLLTILHDVDGFESNRHTACMKMRGSVLSLSYTFPHPPEDTRKRKKKWQSRRRAHHPGQTRAAKAVSSRVHKYCTPTCAREFNGIHEAMPVHAGAIF